MKRSPHGGEARASDEYLWHKHNTHVHATHAHAHAVKCQCRNSRSVVALMIKQAVVHSIVLTQDNHACVVYICHAPTNSQLSGPVHIKQRYQRVERKRRTEGLVPHFSVTSAHSSPDPAGKSQPV
jgi:hypothetical protein